MRSIQEALARDARRRAIIVIASQNAWRGSQVLPGYTASKHAVLGLVRSVALELGPERHPRQRDRPRLGRDGRLPRPAAAAREAGGPSVEEALEGERLTTPLKRLATADEIAAAAVFLASDLSSGVTGHALPVGAP